MLTSQEFSKIIKSQVELKAEWLESILKEYAKKHNLTPYDLKKHGLRVCCLESGKETFMYKKDVICTISTLNHIGGFRC